MDISKIRKKLKDADAGNNPESKPEILEDKTAPDAGRDDIINRESAESKPLETPENTDSIKADAIAVAEAEETASSDLSELELLAFNVASEEYAVKLSDMHEIIRSQTITPLPRAPEYLIGVTFLRGKILPVIDLGKRLGLKWDGGIRQKIIVLSALKAPLGILIGSGIDLLRCNEDEILPPPPILNEGEIGLIAGVVNIKNRFISVLNINNILKAEKQ